MILYHRKYFATCPFTTYILLKIILLTNTEKLHKYFMQIMSHDQMNDNYLFIGKTDILVGHHVALPLTQGAPEWFKTMIN